MTPLSRRDFLGSLVFGGAALLAPSLGGLVACDRLMRRGSAGYGPLSPAAGVPEISIPPGFSALKLSEAGRQMSDGYLTPGAFDGMGAFGLPNGNIRLIRNHELRDGPGAPFGDAGRAYDPAGTGGCTSLEVRVQADGRCVLLRDYVSLGGTIVNCAGGPTPWGSWLTCEESVRGVVDGWERNHGYVFEVPVQAEDQIQPAPLKALGRFVHEAAAVDPRTGVVYETEDQNTAGFYRFSPYVPGNLLHGGRLQMLAIKERPNYDTRTGQQVGVRLPVEWVDIDDPDPASASTNELAVYDQGLAKGGATFARLEGCWYGDGSIYFNATAGGNANAGQVWQYRPRGRDRGQLTLVFESPSARVLNSPDNICASPGGTLLLCENGVGPQFLRGVTLSGEIFDFARNNVNEQEWCGACFSPDGETLFANIQGATASHGTAPSMTFAIWGPWDVGAL